MEKTPEHYKRLDQIDDILRSQGIDLDDLENQSVAKVSFWQSLIKNAENEAEVIDLAGIEFRGDTPSFLDQLQATPAKITPSRAKPPKTDYAERILLFSDPQIDYRRLPSGELLPVHNEDVLKLIPHIAKLLMANTVANLGDTVDLPAQGRFDASSDHHYRTLSMAFQRTHDMYAKIRAELPNARVAEVDSNHNARLGKFVLKHATSLYGLRQAGNEVEEYPVLTYPFLANLAPLDVEFISGYGAAELVIPSGTDLPDLVCQHGRFTSNNGTTASKLARSLPNVHAIQGHDHGAESYYYTTRDGHVASAHVVGCSCKTDGTVEGYHSAVDDLGYPVHRQQAWVNSLMDIIRHHDGTFEFNHINIINGIANVYGDQIDARDIPDYERY